MVFARKLPVVHFDFCLGCTKTKSNDLEQVGHASTSHGAEGGIIEPLFWFAGSLCTRECYGIWGCGGVVGCFSSLSVVVSSLLSEVSSVHGDLVVARQACQDGKGP